MSAKMEGPCTTAPPYQQLPTNSSVNTDSKSSHTNNNMDVTSTGTEENGIFTVLTPPFERVLWREECIPEHVKATRTVFRLRTMAAMSCALSLVALIYIVEFLDAHHRHQPGVVFFFVMMLLSGTTVRDCYGARCVNMLVSDLVPTLLLRVCESWVLMFWLNSNVVVNTCVFACNAAVLLMWTIIDDDARMGVGNPKYGEPPWCHDRLLKMSGTTMAQYGVVLLECVHALLVVELLAVFLFHGSVVGTVVIFFGHSV